MSKGIKEVVSFAVELCSQPEIYDPVIAREIVQLVIELDDFEMSQLETLREELRHYWSIGSGIAERWTVEEMMNLAMVSTSDPCIKEILLKFTRTNTEEED